MNINKIQNYFGFMAIVIAAFSLMGCYAGGDNPGIEYAPDMYIAKGYEPYSQAKSWKYNANGQSLRMPVNGTVARGQLDYLYSIPNTGEGYEMAASLTNPVAKTKTNLADGEAVYNTYCWHCHGKTGKNDGPVMSEKRYVKPPWSGYQDDYIKNLPEGKIYHTIMYGKGFMGSHSALLNPKQRWQVINYVKKLALGDDFKYDAEPAATATTGNLTEETTTSLDENGNPVTLDGVQSNENIGNSSGLGGNIIGGNWSGVLNFDQDNNAAHTTLQASFDNVKFKFASSKFKDNSEKYLEEVVTYLQSKPTKKMLITGHTNKTPGLEIVDEKLSVNRARAVVDYLVSKGISEDRLFFAGIGSEHNTNDGSTDTERRKNRRVEFHLIK